MNALGSIDQEIEATSKSIEADRAALQERDKLAAGRSQGIAGISVHTHADLPTLFRLREDVVDYTDLSAKVCAELVSAGENLAFMRKSESDPNPQRRLGNNGSVHLASIQVRVRVGSQGDGVKGKGKEGELYMLNICYIYIIYIIYIYSQRK